jgi:hypothetical protein
MLENSIIKKICSFVKLKPRSIDEISKHINKNWRTTERYVQKIEKEQGTLSTRIFREGTRGALKIVFWNSIEDIHFLGFQEELCEELMRWKDKVDFSPFEIFQYVEKTKKRIYIENKKINPELEISEKRDLAGILRKTEKQVLMFAGNLSWINAKQGNIKMIDIIRQLAKRGVSIKIIARVSLIGSENIQKLLAINKELGKDIIEIRHRYQPLRAMIIDNKLVMMREVKYPEYYLPGELKQKIAILYDLFDKDWIEWLQKVFWKMFSTAMPAERRLEEIKNIRQEI